MAAIRCFANGWKISAQLWPVVVLLYLVDAMLGLVLVVSPVTQLATILGRSAMAPDLSWPITLNLLAEVRGGFEGATASWALYLLVSLLSLLIGTFLRGGALSTLKRVPSSFLWTEFFADCARFFPRLLLLLLFIVPGVLAVLVLAVAGHLALSLLPMPLLWAVSARGALLAFLFLMLLIALDYARISLVIEPDRSIPRHLARALFFVLRHLPSVVALGLAFLVATAAIGGAYPALLVLTGFSATPLVALVVAQAAAFAASSQRLATVAAEMELYRRLPPESAPE